MGQKEFQSEVVVRFASKRRITEGRENKNVNSALSLSPPLSLWLVNNICFSTFAYETKLRFGGEEVCTKYALDRRKEEEAKG